ncbi:MAG: hypothetical protein IJ391_04965 [Clostridia bacterium]|nr:hypothetical protein [Clostridia bacterium]
MKRIILLFIAVLLFLTACESTEPAKEVSTPVFTVNGELPDIGKFSASKPQERFYKEYTPEFIPSDDYGEIIPFIGNRKTYTTSRFFGEKGTNVYSYGFCTPDGKIVTDSSPHNYIELLSTDNGFEYYYMSVTDDSHDTYYPREYFIPKSGKWCLAAPAYSHISDAGRERILISNPDMHFAVYDYDGKMIFELTDISDFSYYQNGLSAITIGEGDSARCFYIDSDGNKVLGDYRYATDFTQHGIAGVVDENGDCYLIDTKGERVIEKSYKKVRIKHKSNHNSPALFILSDDSLPGVYDVYTDDGGFVNTITLSNEKQWLNLLYLGNCVLYDNDGTLYTLDDRKVYINNTFGDRYGTVYEPFDVIKYSVNDRTAILDENGNILANLFDMYSFEDISNDHRYLLYRSGEYSDFEKKYELTDNSTCYIYDTAENKKLFPLNGERYDYINFTTADKRYVKLYSYNYENHENARNVTLYDTQSQRVLFKDTEYVRHMKLSGKDYFLVCTLNSCALYNSELDIIYKSHNE